MSFVSAVKVCRHVGEGYRVTSPYLDLMLNGTSRCKWLGANVNNALSDICWMKGPQELFWQEIEEHAIHFGTVFEGRVQHCP
jgi:cephalosporin hydroxylase